MTKGANPWRRRGKARSVGKLGAGTDGRMNTPGQHGFHFFPGSHNHLPETMI